MPEYAWIVIGSGIAGLTAAGLLAEKSQAGLVIDKGNRPGGRMASWGPRGSGRYVYDFGAQFFTAREKSFQRQVNGWCERELVKPWFKRGKLDKHAEDPEEMCYRATKGMRSLTDDLAEELDVRQRTKVSAIARQDQGWRVEIEDGTTLSTRTLLVTAPIPQTLALLEAGDITPEREPTLIHLAKARYAPCHSVMALLDGPSGIPEPGALVPSEGPIKIICDNKMKGITDLNAITLQPHHEYSAKHFEKDRKEVGQNLLEDARPYLKAKVTELHVQRWKFSSPISFLEGTHFYDPLLPGLFLAGDIFMGARVEGAFISGAAAAHSMLDYLRGEA